MVWALLLLPLSWLGMGSVLALVEMVRSACGGCGTAEGFGHLNLVLWFRVLPALFVFFLLKAIIGGKIKGFFQVIGKAIEASAMVLAASVIAAHLSYVPVEFLRNGRPFDAMTYVAEVRSSLAFLWEVLT
jgi:hypothetical protein